jgi:hypothetical protein
MSPKIPQFLNLVYQDLEGLDRSGIHFVYTYNRTTALLLAHCLSKVLGMPQLKSAGQARVPGQQHFAMITPASSVRPALRPYSTAEKELAGIREVINSDENAQGSIVKVVIASHKSFKGVDLKHLRYLHLLEPFVNFRDFLQYVGRGPRNCSHNKLKPASRKVDVILYRMAYSPDHDCTSARAALADCFVFNESLKRYTSQAGFKAVEDEVLWKSSVDFDVFKDTLHADRGAIFRMIGGLKCDAAAAGQSSFHALEQSALKARQRSNKQRLNAEYPDAVKFAAMTRRRNPADKNAQNAKKELKEYAEALKALKAERKKAGAAGNGNSAFNARVARLRQEYPRAAVYQQYANATKASERARREEAAGLNVWSNNIRRASLYD